MTRIGSTQSPLDYNLGPNKGHATLMQQRLGEAARWWKENQDRVNKEAAEYSKNKQNAME